MGLALLVGMVVLYHIANDKIKIKKIIVKEFNKSIVLYKGEHNHERRGCHDCVHAMQINNVFCEHPGKPWLYDRRTPPHVIHCSGWEPCLKKEELSIWERYFVSHVKRKQ